MTKYLIEVLKLVVVGFICFLIYKMGVREARQETLLYIAAVASLSIFLWRLFRILEDQIIRIIKNRRNRNI